MNEQKRRKFLLNSEERLKKIQSLNNENAKVEVMSENDKLLDEVNRQFEESMDIDKMMSIYEENMNTDNNEINFMNIYNDQLKLVLENFNKNAEKIDEINDLQPKSKDKNVDYKNNRISNLSTKILFNSFHWIIMWILLFTDFTNFTDILILRVLRNKINIFFTYILIRGTIIEMNQNNVFVNVIQSRNKFILNMLFFVIRLGLYMLNAFREQTFMIVLYVLYQQFLNIF